MLVTYNISDFLLATYKAAAVLITTGRIYLDILMNTTNLSLYTNVIGGTSFVGKKPISNPLRAPFILILRWVQHER